MNLNVTMDDSRLNKSKFTLQAKSETPATKGGATLLSMIVG